MLASGTRIGSYEIIDAIGAGGMGEIYRAPYLCALRSRLYAMPSRMVMIKANTAIVPNTMK